jgi:hypothetical protein
MIAFNQPSIGSFEYLTRWVVQPLTMPPGGVFSVALWNLVTFSYTVKKYFCSIDNQYCPMLHR